MGRRLAFDSAKGRLWAVCPKCRRWNLTPIEERWEAIDECERLLHTTRTRVSTENIGVARHPEGLELVRIGEPRRPEFAAWRYGDQLGERKRKSAINAAAMLGCVGVGALFSPAILAAAPAVVLSPLLFGASAWMHLRATFKRSSCSPTPVSRGSLCESSRVGARRDSKEATPGGGGRNLGQSAVARAYRGVLRTAWLASLSLAVSPSGSTRCRASPRPRAVAGLTRPPRAPRVASCPSRADAGPRDLQRSGGPHVHVGPYGIPCREASAAMAARRSPSIAAPVPSMTVAFSKMVRVCCAAAGVASPANAARTDNPRFAS